MDNLFGDDGDDQLTGGMGSDTIDGGDGWDTATFQGLWDDYTIQAIGSLTRVDYYSETDWLTEVETLEFYQNGRVQTWENIEGTWVNLPEPDRQMLALTMLAVLALLRHRSRRGFN